MKLSREELELIILRHLTADKTAVMRAQAMGIVPEHFTFKQEGVDISYHAYLFDCIQKYFQDSNGYLLTQLVLENRLIERGVNATHRANLAILWATIEEQDWNDNELYNLLTQLKNTKAVDIWSKMFQDAHTKMLEDGLEKGMEVVKERLDEIHAQLENIKTPKKNADITRYADEFNAEWRQRLLKPDQFNGIHCGLPEIDNVTFGWMKGQLIVLLAPSSGGKSVQLLNWADHAHRQGKNVLYFSFEMDIWLCALRHISLRFGVPYAQLKSISYPPEELQQLIEKMKGLDGGPYFEYEVSMEDPTPEYIDSRIRQLANTKGMPDLVVVDYIGNMTTRNARKDAKPWERQGDAVEQLFILAKRHEIPILTAQQINRETIRENRKQQQDGKRAAYYQDAASGDQRLMHLAHFVIGIEPDKENKLLTYWPVKTRDAYFEPFCAYVEPEFNRISELEPHVQEHWREAKGLAPGASPKSDSKPTTRTTAKEEMRIAPVVPQQTDLIPDEDEAPLLDGWEQGWGSIE